MKITQKILENIIKEEISKILKEEAIDPEQSFDAPISAEQLRQEPIAAYIMQTLNREWPTLASQRDLEQLQGRISDLESKMGSAMADSLKTPPGLKENKENPMKITKKILENIIKEELASILQEQEQDLEDRRTAMEKLAALIKAEKDPQKRADLQLVLLMLSTLPSVNIDPGPGYKVVDPDPRSK